MCLTCKHRSRKFDAFNCLQLQLSSNHSTSLEVSFIFSLSILHSLRICCRYADFWLKSFCLAGMFRQFSLLSHIREGRRKFYCFLFFVSEILFYNPHRPTPALTFDISWWKFCPLSHVLLQPLSPILVVISETSFAVFF